VGNASVPVEAGTPAIVFPGQGAQTVGMAGDWVESCPGAADLFARAAEILGYDLLAICRSGPADRLNTTAVSQPAILVTSLAALEVLRGREGHPLDAARITAGLSLGEYTAMVFAGALDFDDAVRLVDVRGRAMQECAEQRPGAMLAVLGVDRDALVALCSECRRDDVLEVANVLPRRSPPRPCGRRGFRWSATSMPGRTPIPRKSGPFSRGRSSVLSNGTRPWHTSCPPACGRSGRSGPAGCSGA